MVVNLPLENIKLDFAIAKQYAKLSAEFGSEMYWFQDMVGSWVLKKILNYKRYPTYSLEVTLYNYYNNEIIITLKMRSYDTTGSWDEVDIDLPVDVLYCDNWKEEIEKHYAIKALES